MELVKRWWNGRYGRIARRDIWLERDTTWHVRARQGDGDSPSKTWTFPDWDQADELVQQLLDTAPGDWKDITNASSASFKPR